MGRIEMNISVLKPYFDRNEKDEVRLKIFEVKWKDKNKSGLVATVFLEIKETHHSNKTTLELSYKCINYFENHVNSGKGNFLAHCENKFAKPTEKVVSLTGGAVFLDPNALQGHGLGTYLMNEIIKWAKQWPEADVDSIELIADQASKENKTRRNRFYEQFGIEFVYSSEDKAAGISIPMKVKQLKEKSHIENIEEYKVYDYIYDIKNKLFHLEYDLSSERCSRELVQKNYQNAKKKPIRWAVRQVAIKSKKFFNENWHVIRSQ